MKQELEIFASEGKVVPVLNYLSTAMKAYGEADV
jgi:hypothetical protein